MDSGQCAFLPNNWSSEVGLEVVLFSPTERAGYDPALLYDHRCFPKATLVLLDRFRLFWYPVTGLNRRPSPCKGVATTAELTGHIFGAGGETRTLKACAGRT